jgi:hypothetical protein
MKRRIQVLDTNYTSIDIRRLNLDFSGFGDYDFLTFKHDGKEYQIGVAKTALHYGGYRYWLKCDYCGRRVVELLVTPIPQMVCRHCLKKRYESENESKLHRDARAARTIRAKLGWDMDYSFYNSRRPKGMHKKTFDRLVAIHNEKSAEVVSKIKAAGFM